VRRKEGKGPKSEVVYFKKKEIDRPKDEGDGNTDRCERKGCKIASARVQSGFKYPRDQRRKKNQEEEINLTPGGTLPRKKALKKSQPSMAV